MKKKNAVEKFCSKFFRSNSVDEIIEVYEKCLEYCEEKEYLEIRDKLSVFQQENNRECLWKANISDMFYIIITACEGGGTEDIEKRENLVNSICDFLNVVISMVKDNCQFSSNYKFRDFALTLLLNVICAFSSNDYKVQHSAMIYDIVQRLNKDISFDNIYGESAKKYIIDCTLDILCRIDMTKKDIGRICKNEDKEFVKVFCILLLENWTDMAKNSKDFIRRGRTSLILFICFLFFIGIFIFGGMNGYKVIREKENSITKLEEQLWKKENGYKDLEDQIIKLQSEKINLEGQIQEKDSEIEALRKKLLVGNEERMDENSYQGEGNNSYKMPIRSNVWKEKNEDSDILGEIEAGEEVNAVSERDDEGWIEILYQEQTGYIKVPDQEPDNS